MVQRSWPHSRNQKLRIHGKPGCDRLSRGTTRPHTDAATAFGVCIFIEFRDSCSAGPSMCNKMKASNEKRSLYMGLLSKFVEVSATCWFSPAFADWCRYCEHADKAPVGAEPSGTCCVEKSTQESRHVSIFGRCVIHGEPYSEHRTRSWRAAGRRRVPVW